jgi:undecaprenyl-diphosphatase
MDGVFGTRAARRHRTAGLGMAAVLLGALLALLLAVLLAVVIDSARSRAGTLHDLDVRVADDLNRYAAAHPGAVSAWKVVTDVGGPVTWRILLAGVVLALWLRRRRREAVVMAAVMVAAAAASGVGKAVVGRRRPVVPIVVDHVAGPSFPSGHALTSFVAVGMLAFLVAPALGRGARALLAIAAATLIATIGFSRLILGVHYLTDVIGGWLIGALLVLAAVSALRRTTSMPGTPPAQRAAE